MWFLNRANAYEKSLPNKKHFKFTAADILSPYYRALVLQLKRVNSERIELQSDFDWDSLGTYIIKFTTSITKSELIYIFIFIS